MPDLAQYTPPTGLDYPALALPMSSSERRKSHLYVLGFMFDRLGRCVLIRKNRPVWQAGKLNGVGGHIERGEMASDAMIREFREETGLDTTVREWQQVGTLTGSDYECYVYVGHRDQITDAKSMTDEPVEIHNVMWTIPTDVVESVRYLIPMVLDDQLKPFHLHYE